MDAPRGRWKYIEETDSFEEVPKPEPKPEPEPESDGDEHIGQYL
jgi:hypothetical protein